MKTYTLAPYVVTQHAFHAFQLRSQITQIKESTKG